MHRIYALREVRERTRTVRWCAMVVGAARAVCHGVAGRGRKALLGGGPDPMTLMVVGVGPVTHAINALKVGDRLWVRAAGPGLGSGERLMLVAGYGVARTLLAERGAGRGMCVDLCWGRAPLLTCLCNDLALSGFDSAWHRRWLGRRSAAL